MKCSVTTVLSPCRAKIILAARSHAPDGVQDKGYAPKRAACASGSLMAKVAPARSHGILETGMAATGNGYRLLALPGW